MAMKVQRSPPPTPKPKPIAEKEDCEFVNTRSRKPPQGSPEGHACPNSDLGEGVRAALASLKNSQDHNVSNLLSNQTTVLTKLLSDVEAIKAQNIEIQKTNEKIDAGMSFIIMQYEDMREEIENLKKERCEQRAYIETLEKKIQDMQSKSRSSGVEIRNIPQHETETPESLATVLSSIGEAVGTPIMKGDLRDIYRLPGKANTPRPVVAELCSVQTKQKLLSAVRDFNRNKKKDEKRLNTTKLGIQGPLLPVNVSEQLPPSMKKLLYLAFIRLFNGFLSAYLMFGVSRYFDTVASAMIAGRQRQEQQTNIRIQAKKRVSTLLGDKRAYLRKKEGEQHIWIKNEQCLEELAKKTAKEY